MAEHFIPLAASLQTRFQCSASTSPSPAVGKREEADRNKATADVNALLPPTSIISMIQTNRFIQPCPAVEDGCLDDDFGAIRYGTSGNFVQLQFAVTVWGAANADEAFIVLQNALAENNDLRLALAQAFNTPSQILGELVSFGAVEGVSLTWDQTLVCGAMMAGSSHLRKQCSGCRAALYPAPKIAAANELSLLWLLRCAAPCRHSINGSHPALHLQDGQQCRGSHPGCVVQGFLAAPDALLCCCPPALAPQHLTAVPQHQHHAQPTLQLSPSG